MALLFVPQVAVAQSPGNATISQARAAGVIDSKSTRSVAEAKIDNRLLFAERAYRQGSRRNFATANVPFFVQRFIDGQVGDDGTTFVNVRVTSMGDLGTWLVANGARDVIEYPDFQGVTATVPLTLVPSIGARAEVLAVFPRESAVTNRYQPAEERAKVAGATRDAIRNVGAQQWGGVTAHKADLAQATGITGAGVKVCVLSDGVDSLATSQGTSDLPAVDVLSGQAGSGDEGTAMLEILHDMAPGASLGFATGSGGTFSFAANILQLRQSLACDILVDGVTYPTESAFMDDNVARAVNRVTAAGAMYFSSAADSGNKTHGHSGTFEGDYVQSAAAIPAAIIGAEGTSVLQMHQFPAGLPFTTLTVHTQVVSLKWSDADGHSSNDYDLFVMDSTATTILGQSFNGQSGTGFPVEVAHCYQVAVGAGSPCNLDAGHVCDPANAPGNCYFPAGARIYVIRYDDRDPPPIGPGPSLPRALHVNTHGGEITATDATPGSTFGHNAAASSITVAASSIAAFGSPARPFNAGDLVTSYTSDGPRKIFYTVNDTVNSDNGAVVATAITPGNFLFATSGGSTLLKVDGTASDCGQTTVTGFTQFCGTSAAAPSAAAIAALIKSAKPTLTKGQVKTALLNSAIDIEAAGTDRNSGAGIVMADNAVKGILTPLTFGKSYSPSTIPVGGVSTLTITVGNSNAIAITGVAFTDSYPAGIVNAASPNAAVSGAGCTATLSATGSGNTFGVTSATIPAGTTCTFTVVVTATGGSGVLNDNSGTVSTPIGLNTVSPSATLTVVAPSQQRAFVSAFGSDANTPSGCGPTTPCRGFTAAASVLVPGGEIVALNAAGYGTLVITKSITIVANPGFYAGITASSGDAITIATAGVKVLLRGLNINGTGGTNGVNMTAGTSLTVENSVISNFTGSGIKVDSSGSTVRLANTVLSGNTLDGLTIAQGLADVVRSRALNNGRAGFMAMTTGSGATAALSVVDSFAAGNMNGFAAIANAASSTARINATRVSGVSNSNDGLHVQFLSGTSALGIVGNSMFSGNVAAGMFNSGGSGLESLGDNLVDLNGTNTSGTITTVAGQ